MNLCKSMKKIWMNKYNKRTNWMRNISRSFIIIMSPKLILSKTKNNNGSIEIFKWVSYFASLLLIHHILFFRFHKGKKKIGNKNMKDFNYKTKEISERERKNFSKNKFNSIWISSNDWNKKRLTSSLKKRN